MLWIPVWFCLAAAPAEPPTGLVVAGAPAGVLLTGAACTDAQTVDDPDALGGRAATASGPWEPLVQAKLPEAGEAFTVWVHRQGGPIQLKAVVNGAQKEKQWDWGQPAAYAWCSLGRYKRADLGDSILIIRGDKQDRPGPRIDCLVFSADATAHPKGMKPDGGKELPSSAPDNSLAPTTASIRIDWDKSAGQMPRSMWGTNDSQVFGGQGGSPGHQGFLRSLQPALIRILDGALIDKWTDPRTRAWRVDQIRAGFAACTGFGDARVMLNIPGWPSWLAKQPDGTLTPAGEDEFVKLVGQLVRVMRDEVHQPVAYWEVFNEKDDQFEKLGKLDELWRLHNRVTAEIKRQDPQAKVGGPAFTWPKPLWVESFLKVCGPLVDFVTWHGYASGDIYDSNEHVFGRVDALADMARYLKGAVAKAIPDRRVECFLDEYNIKWVWDPMEERHGNNVGAVYDAMVLRRMALLGLDGVSQWDSRGHAYGLIEFDDQVRLTGRFYQLGSRCLVGELAEAAAEGEKAVELIAVKRADGVRSVLLINRANHEVIVSGAARLGVSATTPTVVRIASEGLSCLAWPRELAGDQVRLPGYSVTLVTSDETVERLMR